VEGNDALKAYASPEEIQCDELANPNRGSIKHRVAVFEEDGDDDNDEADDGDEPRQE
jgi:hypothetical protein